MQYEDLRKELEKQIGVPLKVAVMGQTGVGKSSLINALFGTHLKTDPIRPCTMNVEHVVAKGTTGGELWFYDLPGVGEARDADATYLNDYKEKLRECDIVLWLMHADNRSVSFDLDSLHKILDNSRDDSDKVQYANLLNKITFVLSKADVLTPSPWILTKLGSEAFFVPHPDVRAILEQKGEYYQEVFVLPFRDFISAQTYSRENLDLPLKGFSYKDGIVSYKGVLDHRMLEQLKQSYPKYTEVFERLADNHRVIACSSLFRFNLALLMRIIIDKLGIDAIARFSNFYDNSQLERMPFERAKTYCNVVVLDEAKGRVIFDLKRTNI